MNRAFKSTPACQVKPGDTVIFDIPRWDVVIEEARPMASDGWTFLTANNDTWSMALKDTDTVRILQVELDAYTQRNAAQALRLQIQANPQNAGYF